MGLTPKELAGQFGLTVKTVQNWELGRTHPDLRNTPRVAQIPKRFGILSTMDFPNRLRLARARLGLSQAQFCVRVGASRDAVWEWEHGNHEPRSDARAAVEKLIEKTLNDDERTALSIHSSRTRLGLTQHELAARLQIYPKTVNRWERGSRKPSEESIEKMERLRKAHSSIAYPLH